MAGAPWRACARARFFANALSSPPSPLCCCREELACRAHLPHFACHRRPANFCSRTERPDRGRRRATARLSEGHPHSGWSAERLFRVGGRLLPPRVHGAHRLLERALALAAAPPADGRRSPSRPQVPPPRRQPSPPSPTSTWPPLPPPSSPPPASPPPPSRPADSAVPSAPRHLDDDLGQRLGGDRGRERVAVDAPGIGACARARRSARPRRGGAWRPGARSWAPGAFFISLCFWESVRIRPGALTVPMACPEGAEVSLGMYKGGLNSWWLVGNGCRGPYKPCQSDTIYHLSIVVLGQ